VGISRSIRRKKDAKEKKKFKKLFQDKLNNVSKSLDSMPMKCDECDIAFDKSRVESHSNWRIAVHDDGQINLVCDKCGKHEEDQ
tara:strand:- start:789 stop:1040 length:252 start_codon:yes stop_codon:yes gene_type:complete